MVKQEAVWLHHIMYACIPVTQFQALENQLESNCSPLTAAVHSLFPSLCLDVQWLSSNVKVLGVDLCVLDTG